MEDDESAAMWHLYAEEGKGLAISTTVGRLLGTCRPFFAERAKKPEDLWYGRVRYVDLLTQKLKAGMMERFFFKHHVFGSEKEFRLAITLAMTEQFGVRVPAKGVSVEVSLDRLIQHVYIGPSVTGAQQSRVSAALGKHGLQDRIVKSCLLGTPRYT